MLLRLRNASLSYGLKPVLDRVDLEITTGERIGLLGRNGTGKSTLLRVVQGEEALDDGLRETAPQARIASLPQDVPPGLGGPVFDVVADGLGETGAALAQFHELTRRLAAGEAVGDRLTAAQARVDTLGGWLLDQRVEAAISRAGLEPGADFGALSGGQQRRVLLARALVQEPDLLLLDEPTNHLDIDTIDALEASLREWHGALLFVTHDRAFLRRLATRILDLDRGHLTIWPGDYGAYLAGKARALEAEARADARFDDRLAQEEAWIRQGIKARRTRNEGRVRALKAMREERRERRALTGQVRLGGPRVQHGGKLVLETEGLSFGYPGSDRPLIKDLSTLVLRGDKIGIVGPNGSGKTTLIRLLLGELEPDSGSVRLGTRLDIVHFDQRRASLDLNASVADNLGQGRTAIEVDGRSRHVMSYLQDFLFTPEQARAPARVLSGGERNRLLLAMLFTRPCNLLVMDEPTNDLDLETLELLEARLVDWPGTLLLVSHDREFLDNIVTSTLVMESGGRVGEYVGGYSDWLRQRPSPPAPPQRSAPARAAAPAPTKPASALSSAERRELGRLPAHIETLEQQIGAIHERMAQPDYYPQGDAATVAGDTEALRSLEAELEQAFERWSELETRQAP